MNRLQSPQARRLAAAGSAAVSIALGLLLTFLLVDRLAPPQDLPWKPLALDQPIGLATQWKLARLADHPDQCRRLLADAGVGFSRTPDRDDGGFCVAKDAVRLDGGVLPLSPRGLTLSCPLAAAYVVWTRQVVEPAARSSLGSPVVGVDTFGSYSCRRMYGRADRAPSEHARANALDVSGFRLRDGRRVSVLKDWRDENGFLRRVRDRGCRVFRTALSPEYNAAHRDHLHLDMGPWPICR